MRLGLLTSSFPRAPGDPAGHFVAEHARWLAGQGWEVEVVAMGAPPREGAGGGRGAEAAGRAAAGAEARPSAGRGSPAAEFLPGISVARVGGGRVLAASGGAPEALERGQGWMEALGVTAAMVRAAALRRRHWDRLVAHWLVPSGLVAALVAGGRPVSAIAHSGDVHLLLRLGLASPTAAILARAGARLRFVSEGLRSAFLRAVWPPRLRRRLDAACAVVPMGVDTARLSRAPAAAPPEERPVVFLGRLVAVKGADVAIAAAARWAAPNPLAIAGEGPEGPALRARARELAPRRVRWLGEVRGGARDRLLSGASAVLLPSRELPTGRSEGAPVTALEAMAAGAPVITSSVGGLAELPEGVAVRVPPDDPRALARAVDALARDRVRRRAQIEAARAFLRHRSWDAVGPRLY